MSDNSSSYDADEVPAAAPAAPPASSCSVNGGCCSKCPFSKLAPENIEATLQRNSACIEEFQGALFFRRPIAFAVLLVSVNFLFFLHRTLNLSFYAKVCLCSLCYLAYQLIPTSLKSTVKAVLFPGTLARGGLNDPDRIRDTNELVPKLNAVLAPFFTLAKIVRKLSEDDSVVGLAIYGSIFLCLFIITAAVDFFWPIVIVTNLALILPGVLTRPQVLPYVEKARQACCGGCQAEQQPAEKVVEAVAAAAEHAAEAVQEAAAAVEEAVQEATE
ncbi:hypothetical protein TRFO_30443 [Tritrichomonas foetus]|uniref:Uncharacterized protein n=1 Tax=Tritrichomonas foetus TaxID=1144522 RepID=A0A1J4JY34_9EUKA|nr:hypothetical protein TRFO_30443 [Tritrichomonas foetus]|eukprot:OHT02444.1 hypothetical protein TRFO_30443 [Tritrichomonas foetus]